MNDQFVFLDTNILIYILNGNPYFKKYLQNKIIISFITELELFRFHKLTVKEKEFIKTHLPDLTIIDINQPIKDIIIENRELNRLKLPDAIIAATCIYLKLPLHTADEKLADITILPSFLIKP
jgi:predicted nucleic acid-binding protein